MKARIANAVIWLYLWFSQALMPVILTDGDFVAAKLKQLYSFGPFDDIPRLIGRGVFPLILWALIDWPLRRRARRLNASRQP